MIKRVDFRLLSAETKKELFRAMGLQENDLEWLKANGNPNATIEFFDNRIVTREQQKKAHVLIGAVAEWAGYTPVEAEKAILKHDFISSMVTDTNEGFSLSNCTVETAREFISWLIDFCLSNGVPCREPMYKLADDSYKYTWACAMNQKCCVCGQKTELHHVDAVGMGRNRKEICHLGMRVLPLCEKHHREIHRIGRESFLERYHLEPVVVDGKIADKYKLRRNKK